MSFKFSQRSLSRLEGVHPNLVLLAKQTLAISPIDFGITHGLRTPDEQFELFKKGRELKNGKWSVIDKSKIVTFVDGHKRKSKHNTGEAFDIAVWRNGKITWEPKYYHFLAGLFLMVAKDMGIDITLGMFFNGFGKDGDFPHIELK